MHVSLLTLFPAFFESPLRETILKRAIEAGHLTVDCIDIRTWGVGRHHVVDDTPYGGGAGMVMRVDPVVAAIRHVRERDPNATVALLGPRGTPLTQALVHDLATRPHLALVCGRYEGFDERVRPHADLEISLGDFILSGGEPAALCIVDAVARLLDGVLGNAASTGDESFSASGLLEYPHYTRPPDFEGQSVPAVLSTGDHAKIARWRRLAALAVTAIHRPDLLDRANVTPREREWLDAWLASHAANTATFDFEP